MVDGGGAAGPRPVAPPLPPGGTLSPDPDTTTITVTTVTIPGRVGEETAGPLLLGPLITAVHLLLRITLPSPTTATITVTTNTTIIIAATSTTVVVVVHHLIAALGSIRSGPCLWGTFRKGSPTTA